MEERLVNIRLRVPDSLKRWVEEKAAQNERSMNKEILFRLGEMRRQDLALEEKK